MYIRMGHAPGADGTRTSSSTVVLNRFKADTALIRHAAAAPGRG
jgi:hypothetical protein